MKFLALFTIAAAALPSALAFCCHGILGQPCADGTKGTPCCATQSCNIFCCACGGHCRTNGKRDVFSNLESREVSDAFAMADADNSGNVTLDQYLYYMHAPTAEGEEKTVYIDWFKKLVPSTCPHHPLRSCDTDVDVMKRHDKNGDGVITPDEISLQ
ncbi:hypothetical protein QBC46DRAFT_419196 [Diplogelasinospora grovesii]|uniref:EF-hand domain-containing protein n=1 Tax=Diplogelasinospora grovesii TaxID=303347 RepID=A0AAN6N1H4_9PEZI|nr:hypothetical protein QBC46DRAFT_419196 [Diplogelasinospora grovesii]